MHTGLSYSENTTLTKNKQSLHQLETKIRVLQSDLNQDHNKQSQLKQEAANTQVKITEGLQRLKDIQNNIEKKQNEINPLQQQIDKLNSQINKQQSALKLYVSARYKMNDNQTLSLLLNHKNQQTSDQILTYYQYLIRSTKQLMNDIKESQKELLIKKIKLDHDMLELNHLKEQGRLNQQKLTHNQKYHEALMNKLNQNINDKQQTLEIYKRNQVDLSRLVTKLAQQSVLQTKHPLVQLKRKMIKPVAVEQINIQKINQGLLFNAPDGTHVNAVASGKVIFCNWLNGYGWLLIIDHGWGFMTLYANNLALFKQKGDTVSQGEQIATVGHSGAFRKSGLYFEIRHRGKAVPPLDWLR